MRTRRILAVTGDVVLSVVILTPCLFASRWTLMSNGIVGEILREMTAALQDVWVTTMLCFCFGLYFMVFSIVRFQRTNCGLQSHGNPALWLVVPILAATLKSKEVSGASGQTTVPVLLAGVVLGQWVIFYHGRSRNKKGDLMRIIILSLICVLSATSARYAWHGLPHNLYQGHPRWVGAWDSPNTYGLLMGTGAILALGVMVQTVLALRPIPLTIGNWTKIGRGTIICAGYLLSLAIMGRGLKESYSRGAWFATGCGLVYLAIHVFSPQYSFFSRWIRRNVLSFGLVLLSLFILAFWQFRQTAWRPVHRAFSAANAADFSWRNRIAAWEGALQMVAEHSWFGGGWNRVEPLYDYYYLPHKLDDGTAIETNDGLMFAAALGMPALMCFCMYLWLSLTRGVGRGAWGTRCRTKEEGRRKNVETGSPPSESSTLNSQLSPSEEDWLKMTCRAGAIVLLIGFWFDGGLFKLATASTFWILLELGSTAWNGEQPRNEATKETQALTA